MSRSRYKGDLVAGALLVNESRKIARLMIGGLEKSELMEKVIRDNVVAIPGRYISIQ